MTLTLAATSILALSACGGDEAPSTQQADEAQITALTERFEAAIEAKDPEAFCELLAPNDVQRLGEGESDGTKECLITWGAARNPLFGARDVELEIEGVSFERPYATAELASGGELSFAKEEGRWYVHLSPEGEAGR